MPYSGWVMTDYDERATEAAVQVDLQEGEQDGDMLGQEDTGA